MMLCCFSLSAGHVAYPTSDSGRAKGLARDSISTSASTASTQLEILLFAALFPQYLLSPACAVCFVHLGL